MRIACVVLAAGLGKRFGGAKARAEAAPGVRFLDAVIETAVSAALDPVVAVVSRDVMVPNTAFAIINENGAGEQVESARLGLASVVAEVGGAIVWPVDHPFVLSATVHAMLEAVRAADPDAAVPVHDGQRGHPVYFAKRTWERLHQVPDGGARAVIRELGARVLEIPVSDAGILADLDTPEALTAWQIAHPRA